MFEKRSKSHVIPAQKLITNHRDQHTYGIIRKLHQDIELPKDLIYKANNLSLPKLLGSRKSNRNESKPFEKKGSVQQFIREKREILLSKMRVIHKKEYMNDLQQGLMYEEKQLHQRIDDLKESTNMVKKNFEDQKKRLENLVQEVNEHEEMKNDKTRILLEVKNQIYQKNNELRFIKDRVNEYKGYSKFMRAIFEYFNRPLDDRSMSKVLDGVDFSDTFPVIKELFTVNPTSSKEEDNSKKVDNFFLTSKADLSMPESPTKIKRHNRIQEYFIEMIQSIESENITLLEELQNQEFKYAEFTEYSQK